MYASPTKYMTHTHLHNSACIQKQEEKCTHSEVISLVYYQNTTVKLIWKEQSFLNNAGDHPNWEMSMFGLAAALRVLPCSDNGTRCGSGPGPDEESEIARVGWGVEVRWAQTGGLLWDPVAEGHCSAKEKHNNNKKKKRTTLPESFYMIM